MSEIIGLERRIYGLMKDHERLLGVLVVDETDQGWYAIVVRDWPHPDEDDAKILAERYAYLTKGDGNDGWVSSGDGEGGNGVNRRDSLALEGRLAGALAKLYLHASKIQKGGEQDPLVGNLVGGE